MTATQAPTPGQLSAEPLDVLLKRAVEAFKALPPDERRRQFDEQKRRWVAAEMAMGDEGTRLALAPTALVEASGAEHIADELKPNDIAAILEENADADADGLHNASQLAEAIYRRFEALRPQPSGETREVAFLLDRLADFENDINERDWQGHVAPAIARVKAALSTTPARSEVQDEVAAGEPWGYGARRVRIDGSACEAPWTPGKINDGLYMLIAGDPDWEIVILYAHPSPTPAADADRVREAMRELIDADKELAVAINFAEPTENNDALTTAEYRARAARNRAEQALAALKSTAAKEGGK